MGWSLRSLVCLLVLGTAAPAFACDDPVPLPPVPWVYGPTCWLVRADDPDPVSVVPSQAVTLLQTTEAGGGGPFDGERLHPLGFSPDGRFAYVRSHEHGEGYAFGVRVVDLRSDTEIARLDSGSEADPPVSGLIEALARHRGAIHSLLLDHGIEARPLPVLGDRFTSAGTTYSVEIRDVEVAEKATVWLTAEGRGSKQVGTLTAWSACRMCGAPRAHVILSPHEPRAVILVAMRGARFESDIPETTHAVFGSHLTERLEETADE